jgi:hypothetical protein
VKIDEYVTHHRKFAEINNGFHDMHVSNPAQDTPIAPISNTTIIRLGTAFAA